MEHPDNKNKINSIVLTAAITVITVSFFVLIGWFYDIDIFKKASINYTSMAPDTAISFILLSFSVYFLNRKNKNLVFISKFLSILVTVFSLAVLINIVFEINANFENPFRSLNNNFPNDGRMSGISALNFICIGIVLFLFSIVRFKNKIFPLVFLPLIISSFVISGYIYDVSSLYSFGLFSSMAINAALLFIVLSTGIIFLFKDSFLIKIISSKSFGSKLLLRVLPSILLFLVVIKLLTLFGSSRGIYSHEFGEALEIVVFCISIILVVFWNTKILYRYDIKLDRTHKEITLLYEAGIKLGNSLDLNTIYDNIYDIIKNVMECDGFVISTYTPEDKLIHCNYMRRHGEYFNTEPLPALHLTPENLGTQSDVIQNDKSLLISDFQNTIKKTKRKYFIDREGKRVYNIPKDEELDKSALMVPIRINNKVAGVIQVLSKNKNAYTSYHLKFLEAFSPQIAAAIENANLYKQAQKELEERIEVERTLRLTQFSVDKSTDAITWVNMDGKFTDVNDAAIKLFGVSKDEFLGFYIWDFDINASKNTWFEFKEKLRNEGKDLSESVIKNGKNECIPVEILANYVVFEGQEYIVAYVRDITVRKKAEEVLRINEEKLTNAMQIAHLGYWEYDIIDDIFTFNDQFYSIFRTTASKVGGYTMTSSRYAEQFVHPDDQKLVGIEIKKALETTDPNYVGQIDHRIIFGDGEIGYISVRFFVIKDEKGRTIKTYGANQDITERKKAEYNLKASELKYRQLFESIPLPVIIFDDENFEILNVNKIASSVYGYTYDEFLKLKITEIRPKEDIENFKKILKDYKPGEAYFGNWRHCKKDGSSMHVEVTSYGLIYEGRNARVSLIKDVTENKMAEIALKDSENKYRQLFESIPMPIYIADADTLQILSVNETFLKVYGYSWNECLKLSIKDLRPQEELDKFIDDVYKEYSNYRGEWIHRKKDGSLINVEITRYIILYEGRKAFVVLINDITEKKHAQEEIFKTKEQLQNIFNNLDNVFWSIDLVNNKVLQVSPACLKVFGRTQEEFYDNPNLWIEVVHPDDKHRLKFLNPSFFDEQSFINQYRIIHKNGDVRWVEHSVKCIWDQNNNLIRLDGISTDITERIKSEEALKQSEERFKQVAESSEEWIWEVDTEGLYTYASPIVEKILGYIPDEIVGKKHFYDLFETSSKELLKNAAFEVFKNKQAFKNLINVNIHKNGKLVTLETNGVPILDTNGNLLGYRGADTDVTEKREIEERLRLTQYSVENSTDSVIWIDRIGNFVNVNEAACKLVNLNRESLLKLNVSYFNKDYSSEKWEAFWKIIRDKKSYNTELKFYTDKNKIIYVDILANYIKYGETEYIIVFGRNITERKESSEALKLSEEYFRGIFESSSSSIIIFDRDTIISMANDMFCENTGYSKKELIGTSWTKLVHPKDLDRVKEFNRKRLVAPNEAPSKYEFSYIKKDGEIRDTLVSISILPGNSKIIASLIDITERKKAEEGLLESELKYRTLVEGMNEGILQSDLDERILFVNDQMCKITGYSKEELIGKVGFDILLKEEDRKFIIEKNILRFQGLTDKYEIQLKHKSGKLIWVEISASPSYDIWENIIGSIAVIMDINDKKYAETNLRKLSSAVEQSFASVVITDVNGNIEYVNPHFTNVTGYSIDEVFGKNPRFLQSGETKPEIYKELWDSITGGSEWRGELLNKKKNGVLYWENICISPVKNVDGEITNFLAIFEDVTEKKFKDEQIRNSLKEKNVMLKEIHHRVKNNLQIISSLLKLQSSYIKDPQVLEYFQVSQNRIRSMALIHQQLYNSQNLTKINFKDYLKSLSKELIAYNVSNKNITINVNVKELFFNIETSIPCGLIVNELITNSLKHAFKGRSEGIIDIELFNIEKNRYTLFVRDNGVGLPATFDLNNPHSLGTELVVSLVDQLDGTIEMENHFGTTCKIIFSDLNYSKRI